MKITAIPAAALLAACFLLPVQAHAASWQEAYRETLDAYRSSDSYYPETTGEVTFGARWDLCDVNGDDIPELFISPDTSHAFGCRVYSFIGGEAVLLEEREGQLFGEYGLTNVCPEAHLIRGYHFGMGTEIIGYYAFDGEQITEKDHFIATSVYLSEDEGTEDTYTRNGAEISEEEYNAAVEGYEALAWTENVGRAYSFDDMSPLEGGGAAAVSEAPVPLTDFRENVPDMKLAVIFGTIGACVLCAAAALVSKLLRRRGRGSR